jgi:hypothetical protein
MALIHTFCPIVYPSSFLCFPPCSFLQLLDMGERLIKAGVLYADDTPVEQMREVQWAMYK